MAIHDQRIYLASASPRRRELLKQVGVHFEVLLLRAHPSRRDVDEAALAAERPEDYVVRVARAKAQAGCMYLAERHLPRFPVLAADTTVTVDGDIIGKPAGREEAEAILQRLSGKTHQVMTGIAVAFDNHVESALSITHVEFKQLDAEEIRRYVATGEPHDKAGAYAIQGRAAIFISCIEGSYSGVMGLPLFETAQLLQQFHVALL